MKDKTASSTADAFEDVFQKSGRVPRKLRTDQGLEFRGRALQALLERYGVHYFTSNNETKEAVVEVLTVRCKAVCGGISRSRTTPDT